VTFDAPGAGGSATSRWPMTMGQHATLVGKVLDRMGFASVDVLGLSWGGLLAQKLALASVSGTLWFLLRPAGNAKPAPKRSITSTDLQEQINRQPRLAR